MKGTSTSSLGNLYQCLTTLIVENFFLIPNLKLPYCSLKPSPLVSYNAYRCKKIPLVFWQTPFGSQKAALRPLSYVLLSRHNSPNSLSLSSQERCSSSLHLCGLPLNLLRSELYLASRFSITSILSLYLSNFFLHCLLFNMLKLLFISPI